MPSRSSASGGLREQAARIFEQALEVLDVERHLLETLTLQGSQLSFAEASWDLDAYQRVVVLSAGKAGIKMARAAHAVLGDRVDQGLVISNVGIPFEAPWPLHHGGHPIPDAASLRAGEAALELVQSCDRADCLLLFFISGGASAQLEVPILGLELEDLVAANQVLVTSSAPIAEINALRCALSQVKGGGLARAAGSARQISFYLSDVEAGDLASIASGPSYPQTSSVESRLSIMEKHGLADLLPPSVRSALELPSLPDVPEARMEHHLILDSSLACQLLIEELRRDGGWRVEAFAAEQPGDVGALAASLLAEALARKSSPATEPLLLVSMGEVTCPAQGSGLGGRNQELVLRLAVAAARHGDLEYAFLSAGTDGIDGNSPAAGAVADCSSLLRARALEMDPEAYLRDSDSYRFFSRLGDSLVTGASGNNLRDLRLLLLP